MFMCSTIIKMSECCRDKIFNRKLRPSLEMSKTSPKETVLDWKIAIQFWLLYINQIIVIKPIVLLPWYYFLLSKKNYLCARKDLETKCNKSIAVCMCSYPYSPSCCHVASSGAIYRLASCECNISRSCDICRPSLPSSTWIIIDSHK